MKPLIVLIVAFAVLASITYFYRGHANILFSGNVAMFLMLILTAIGHFKFTQGMMMMVPAYIPFKKELVYATGVLEILLGIGLLFPASRQISGIALVILFILMLPANITGAINQINYEKASYDGPGLGYLWFRVPLQLFFICWVTFFSIKN